MDAHDLSDLIGLREACSLLPSHRPGKRLHLATLRRWCQAGRVPSVRIGGYFYVRKSDLGCVVEVMQGPRQRQRAPQTDARTAESLRRHGLGRYV